MLLSVKGWPHRGQGSSLQKIMILLFFKKNYLLEGTSSEAFGPEVRRERTIRQGLLAWEENLAPAIWWHGGG